MAGTQALSHPETFWAAYLTSDLTLFCAAVAAGCVAMLAIGLRALRRAHAGRPPADRAGQRGTATIEFALVAPILLFLMLLLAQTAMLMSGNLFVHYAAFAANRSAVVQIPRDLPTEPANAYYHEFGGVKHDAIWRAAVYALAPVGSRAGGSGQDVDTDLYVEGLTALYEGYGRTPPAWIERIAADRLAYAADTTEMTVRKVRVLQDHTVEYEEIGLGESATFSTHETISVRVRHELALGVPYVSSLYRDGENDGGDYRTLVAHYMLSNEGMRDALPPQPTIQRTTP